MSDLVIMFIFCVIGFGMSFISSELEGKADFSTAMRIPSTISTFLFLVLMFMLLLRVITTI
jgi:hypothetical protein